MPQPPLTMITKRKTAATRKEAEGRYQAAREAHVARMTALGKPLVEEYWPQRYSCMKEVDDGDSSDGLYLRQYAQCG